MKILKKPFMYGPVGSNNRSNAQVLRHQGSWLLRAVVTGLAFASLLAQAAQPADAVQEVVIVRANDGVASQVNVSHKGQLQAALNAGEYTRMPVCQGEASFDAVVWAQGASIGQTQLVQPGAAFEPRQHVVFLELSPSGRIWSGSQARDSVDWAAMRLHSRVVSRVVPQCDVMDTPVPVASLLKPTPTEVRTMELASDLIFPFASSSIDQNKADAMLRERLHTVLPAGDVSRITRIRVVGHSDPVGQPHRKHLVSLQRAQEVANYLKSMLSVSSSLFEVETQSDKQLLVTDCPQKPLILRNECNAPNRRVEVLISLNS